MSMVAWIAEVVMNIILVCTGLMFGSLALAFIGFVAYFSVRVLPDLFR